MWSYFSNIFGIITRSDSTTENGGLFLAHYFTLKIMLGIPILDDEKRIFIEKMNNSIVRDGLYLRSRHHTKRTVSHDELTGMFVSSYILDTNHREKIMNHLEKNFLTYNSTGVLKTYQPSNFYAWGVFTNRVWTKIFFPFYCVSFFISIKKSKNETSSKLIYLNELYHMSKIDLLSNFLFKYFKYEMINQYGQGWVGELFYIYFKNEDVDFPLRELSKGVILK